MVCRQKVALPLLRKGHQLPNITTKIGVLRGATSRPGNLPTLTTALVAEVLNPATLDTYLLTQGYTAAQLKIMNENDKIRAWRTKRALL